MSFNEFVISLHVESLITCVPLQYPIFKPGVHRPQRMPGFLELFCADIGMCVCVCVCVRPQGYL